MLKRNSLLVSSLFVVACGGFQDDSDIESSSSRLASVQPAYVPGNPTCADLGYAHEVKGSDAVGTHELTLIGGATLTYTLDADKTTLSWSSPDLALDAVFMKAGDGAYVYPYDPEANADADLQTPNNNGGNQADLSHVNFCYDLDVLVEKTASTSFERDHAWSIQKTAAETNVLLSLNQVYNLAFDVIVSVAGFTDSGWAVGGTITVTNPDPDFEASLSSITDSLSNFGAIAVNCGEGVTFPITLSPAGTDGDSIVCTYSTPLPSGATRVNTATATAEQGSKVGGGSDSVDVVFSTQASTVDVVDGCVSVTDLHAGDLGQVCATEGSKTFSYTVPLASDVCGPYELTNTATYTGADETGSSTVVVGVDIPCVTGCTLTQGYWKTHSSFGPAPHDEDGWAGHEHDAFFSSGLTAYQVLWTPPAGNAYYVLAHQYIAAARNFANGAQVPGSVQTAFDAATALFGSYTPAQVKALKGNNAVKQQFISLGFALDQYNNGITGPGHCSE